MTKANDSPAPRRALPIRLLVRQVHLYVGVVVAPTLLFFALTGMLQLFTLHEAHGDYRPPPVIEKLGMFHKDQVFALKPKRPGPAAPSARKPQAPEPGRPPSVLALKVFFLLAAISLVASTLLGLWMAVTQSRRKGLVWLLLALGAVTPFLLAQL